MLNNCPICNHETIPEREIRGGKKATNYVCENCNIVWYIDADGKMKITVSVTHSRARKLNDEEFEKLLKRIAEYDGP